MHLRKADEVVRRGLHGPVCCEMYIGGESSLHYVIVGIPRTMFGKLSLKRSVASSIFASTAIVIFGLTRDLPMVSPVDCQESSVQPLPVCRCKCQLPYELTAL